MKIKTTMRYHLIPVRMAINKNNKETAGVGKDVEKREHLCTVGGNINWYSHYRKHYGGSSKNEKQNYHSIQPFHSWVFIRRKQKCYLKKIYTPNVHSNII